MTEYYWTWEEEARLLELWKKGITNPSVLAKEIDRKPGAIEKKLERLSLSPQWQTTTTVPLTKGLLTHEDSTGPWVQSTLQLCVLLSSLHGKR